MIEPRCTKIVNAKNLWEIAVEFISKIDDDLMEFNLKAAYITYRISKLMRLTRGTISKLVFLSCFNGVGKLYVSENSSDPQIETYLFLKYFSPLKNFADTLLSIDPKYDDFPLRKEGMIYKFSTDFTSVLLETTDKEQALKRVLKEKAECKTSEMADYGRILIAFEKLVEQTDIIFDMNSLRYKTVIYKYVSKMLFSAREKNKFFTMLASLFEMYSAQTLYHSKMTAIIGYNIAKYMRIPQDRAKRVYVAGLCHDLGKVCIPLKILEKPDKLTDEEFAIMKTHVSYTKEILRNKIDYEIIETAYRHHERLDGTGYPERLTEIEQTLDQKILQVADVISALIAKRSYKEAWSIDKTIGILDDLVANGKFDKEVVSCFKTYQKKILKTTDDFARQADKVYSKIQKERKNLTKKIETNS